MANNADQDQRALRGAVLSGSLLLAIPSAAFQGITLLTPKAPNTTIAKFSNTADPDETAPNELSYLDLQCLPCSH